MNKQIHRASAPPFQDLLSITSVRAIALSILVIGYAGQGIASDQEASPEAVAKRIAPVGAVYVAPAPEENIKEEATTTPTKDKEDKAASPKKPMPTDGKAS